MHKVYRNMIGQAKRRRKPPTTIHRQSQSGVAYVASYDAVPEPKAYQPNPDLQNAVPDLDISILNSVGWGG